MAFISNKKRTKISHKIDNSYTFKKLFLLITFIDLIVYAVLVVLGVLGSANGIHLFGHTFSIHQNDWFWWFFGFGDKYVGGTIELDKGYGLFILIYSAILLAAVIVSIIFIVQIQSPKKVASQTVLLETSAIPGKKKGGTHKQRIAKAKLEKQK